MACIKKNRSREKLASRLKHESGVVAVIVGICLFVFAVATALAIDVGSLFEDRRHIQTVADAAALAGAQELPEDPDGAIEKAINYSAKREDIVLDLFGGSGSTLIACERLNRKCYMMEIDPKYVQVIIDRWEAYSGKTAQRV